MAFVPHGNGGPEKNLDNLQLAWKEEEGAVIELGEDDNEYLSCRIVNAKRMPIVCNYVYINSPYINDWHYNTCRNWWFGCMIDRIENKEDIGWEKLKADFPGIYFEPEKCIDNISSISKKNTPFGGYFELGLKVGDVIRWKDDKQIIATIADNKHVNYKNEIISLTTATHIIKGSNGNNAFRHWLYNGTSLWDLFKKCH